MPSLHLLARHRQPTVRCPGTVQHLRPEQLRSSLRGRRICRPDAVPPADPGLAKTPRGVEGLGRGPAWGLERESSRRAWRGAQAVVCRRQLVCRTWCACRPHPPMFPAAWLEVSTTTELARRSLYGIRVLRSTSLQPMGHHAHPTPTPITGATISLKTSHMVLALPLVPPPNPAAGAAPGRGDEGPTGTEGGTVSRGVWPRPRVSWTITCEEGHDRGSAKTGF